jgi:hypothetical protein
MKLTLINEQIRRRALDILATLPLEPRQEIIIRPAKSKRSLAQNAKMWPLLQDVSDQVEWYGNKLTPDEWKDVFTAAYKRQKTVPGIDGGFVVIGAHTSKMSVSELSDIIEIIYAFGSERNVRWSHHSDE